HLEVRVGARRAHDRAHGAVASELDVVDARANAPGAGGPTGTVELLEKQGAGRRELIGQVLDAFARGAGDDRDTADGAVGAARLGPVRDGERRTAEREEEREAGEDGRWSQADTHDEPP